MSHRMLTAAALAGLILAPALAAQAWPGKGGVAVRVNGNHRVGPEEREEVVLVIRGDARVEGTAEVLVVIEGNAVLANANVREVTVVRGQAEILEGTRVAGNIYLLDANVQVAPGAQVLGNIERRSGVGMARGLWLFAAVFALGLSLALILSGLVAAAVAPQPLRAAGRALTDDLGNLLLAVAVVWIVLPLAAVAVLATVVGIPAGLGFFIFVMPTIGFLGFLVVGTRVGDFVLEQLRGATEPDHPYLAALIGISLLLVVSLVPMVGGFLNLLAGVVGGGAVALTGWRAGRRPTRTPEPVAAAPETFTEV